MKLKFNPLNAITAIAISFLLSFSLLMVLPKEFSIFPALLCFGIPGLLRKIGLPIFEIVGDKNDKSL